MSFRIVRQSKFRHVFGKEVKKEECYDGVRITKNAWDSNFCSVNPKFIAVVVEQQGGGAFLVLNIEDVGRVALNAPKVCGHTSEVLDVKFCPFNDYVIASCSEDCTVKVWEIPQGGLKADLTAPVVDLVGHQRRVGIVEWHPTAENILYSAGFDYMVYGWNVGTGERIVEIACHSDTIYSLSFNWVGDLLCTTSKDKEIRIIDARSGKLVSQGQGHQGTKPTRVVWCGTTNKLFTTGFSKMSERQYGVWDPTNLGEALKIENVDTSSGVLFPFWDEDTQMVYLGGKGDGNIRYFELADTAPYAHFLSEYKSAAPQRGLGVMPKRGMNIGDCEIMRFYKLHPKGFIEPISFTVPRKATTFQDDIFVPTKKDEATMTAAEWLKGANVEPVRVSLAGGYVQPERAKFETSAVVQATKTPDDETPKGEKELLKAYHSMKEEIKQLKAQLATAEIKIRTLESK